MNNDKINYKVICKFDFYLNDKMLNFVYLPLLGADAITLYRFLHTDYVSDTNMGYFSKDTTRILKNLKWNYEKYNDNKNSLEAVGLLNTYLDSFKTNNIIFSINESMRWEEFKSDHKMITLFKQRVNPLEFDRVKYSFEGNDKLLNFYDISCNFDSYFNNLNLNNINTFDFNFLYDSILKMSNKMLVLNDRIKSLIESYYKTYELSFKEILNIVYQSIFLNEKNIEVDDKLLKLNFEKSVKSSESVNINYVLKINRNHKIFSDTISNESFNYVISDYKTINSEQYLSAISKSPIETLHKNLIKMLRKQYQLPDYLINVLIDYSIYKNAGRIEPMYIQKIAMSIVRLNILQVEDLIDHLKNSNNIIIQNNNTKKTVFDD